MKIAVPNNKLFSKLYGNTGFIEKTKDLQLFKVNEQDTHKLLLAKKVDAALVSPYGYGIGHKNANFRIVPETALSSVDYTGLASVFFKQGLHNIAKVASKTPDDFMIKIGSILLAEKYGFDVELFAAEGDINGILKKFDAVILWEKSNVDDNALDISDEWFDMFEMPLPLFVWVTWEDAVPDKLVQYIRNMAAVYIENEESITESVNSDADFNIRQGHLFWSWTDEVEKAFEQILHFLYFHQFFSHIPAIKVLGRD
jgi:predicted solute-binding protein